MSSDSRNLLVPFSGVAILIAAISGFVWLDRPLESIRPREQKAFIRESFDDEDVRARLWQDPFRAIQEAIPERNRDLASLIGKLHDDSLIMPVMVPSSNFVEDVETRMRSRYALLSGLATEGYVPRISERIGFVNTSWTKINRILIFDDSNKVADRRKTSQVS